MTAKRFVISIDPDLLERLKKVAQKNKTSINSAITYAIEDAWMGKLH